MGDVIPFKRPGPQKNPRGNILCRRGFHKWEIIKEKKFDVKYGQLITQSRCKRCGKEKTEMR
ncbi:MAG TPA: hypothetical protein ENJ84_04760 [Gammaproteobacteria bacterium]|nr:hypothetical protein [Gammaproteobacteria bacterium]